MLPAIIVNIRVEMMMRVKLNLFSFKVSNLYIYDGPDPLLSAIAMMANGTSTEPTLTASSFQVLVLRIEDFSEKLLKLKYSGVYKGSKILVGEDQRVIKFNNNTFCDGLNTESRACVYELTSRKGTQVKLELIFSYSDGLYSWFNHTVGAAVFKVEGGKPTCVLPNIHQLWEQTFVDGYQPSFITTEHKLILVI